MRTEPELHYLALAGPTASGKTAAALAIACKHAIEIISVDSALVYRGMDIGTAKPSSAELAAVPHYLINIRDPLQPYSAAEFVTDARALIADISARGKLPLLVGGTMLYFKTLIEGIDAMPKADAEVRALIEAEALEKGWGALHAELALVDPATAARLNPADSQRIARALEVFRLSGRPLSSFHTTRQGNHAASPHPSPLPGGEGVMTRAGASARSPDEAKRNPGMRSKYIPDSHPGYKLVQSPCAASDRIREARNDNRKWADESLLISLEPQDRAWLHQRIAERFDAMLAAGLIDEVNALRARGDLHADLPAMRCVGYRQVWQYLDAQGVNALDRATALADLRNKGISATRQLAKRQLTWLRAMPQRHVVRCDAPNALDQVLALARGFVERNA